jgi:hypothetical protein
VESEPFGYAGAPALGIDIMAGLQRFNAQQETETNDADNSSWATLSFLVGAAAVTGVWYFYYRPKARRR